MEIDIDRVIDTIAKYTYILDKEGVDTIEFVENGIVISSNFKKYIITRASISEAQDRIFNER